MVPLLCCHQASMEYGPLRPQNWFEMSTDMPIQNQSVLCSPHFWSRAVILIVNAYCMASTITPSLTNRLLHSLHVRSKCWFGIVRKIQGQTRGYRQNILQDMKISDIFYRISVAFMHFNQLIFKVKSSSQVLISSQKLSLLFTLL